MSNARLKRKLRSLKKRGLIPARAVIPAPRKRQSLRHRLMAFFHRLLNKPDPIPDAGPKLNLRPQATKNLRPFAPKPKERARIKR